MQKHYGDESYAWSKIFKWHKPIREDPENRLVLVIVAKDQCYMFDDPHSVLASIPIEGMCHSFESILSCYQRCRFAKGEFFEK